MTTTPIWTVWCDAKLPDCEHWCGATQGTAREARASAVARGWHAKGPGKARLDICPACWKAGAR